MKHKLELTIDDMTSAELAHKMTGRLSNQINGDLVELGAPALRLGGAEQMLLAVVSSSALAALITGVFGLIRRPSKVSLEGSDGTKLSIEADGVDPEIVRELAEIAGKLSSASLRVESMEADR